MGELLSLLQHYFAESPAVISEVETMLREKGIGISLPKEHPSQAALSLLETLFGERGDGSSYQRTACLMARTALVLLMQMMKKKGKPCHFLRTHGDDGCEGAALFIPARQCR